MARLEPLYERYCRLIHRTADRIRLTEHSVMTQLMAETLACMILLFYVDGAAVQHILGPAQLLSNNLGCGAAVTVAIVVCGRACPALVNPALALAHALIGRLRWSLLPAYVLLEFLGAYLGAGLVLAVYHNKIVDYAIQRDGGAFLMNSTGNIFVTYSSLSSIGATVLDHVLTTAFLAFGIYAILENRLPIMPAFLTPAGVGILVFLALSAYSATGGAPLNPARDFGPRMMLLSTFLVMTHTIIGRLRWSLLPAYVLLEFLGACLGAGLVLAVYHNKIVDYAIQRDGGAFLMNSTGNIFVTYSSLSSIGATVLDHVLTTAFLAFGIYAVLENRLPIMPAFLTPAGVGILVFLALSAYSATDWGPAAFSTGDYYFWVALVAPTIGMAIGAILYEVLIGIHTNTENDSLHDSKEEYSIESDIVYAESVYTN